MSGDQYDERARAWLHKHVLLYYIGSDTEAQLAASYRAVAAEAREADARVCESVCDDCHRESRHEPLMMRNAAGAGMCAKAIRAKEG